MKSLFLLLTSLFCTSLSADALFFNKPAPEPATTTAEKSKDETPVAKDETTSDDEGNEKDDENGPLFAGTLLQIYAKNAEPGRLSVQPYFFATYRYGFYDSHSEIIRAGRGHIYSGLLSLQSGLTKTLDFTVVLTAQYEHNAAGSSSHPGDTVTYLGVQLLEEDRKGTKPDLRLLIAESFPTGTVDRLDVDVAPIDFTGDGTFDTILVLAARKTFYYIPRHPFDININLYYITSVPNTIEGLSIFSIDPRTFGIIAPGDQYIGNFAIDYMLTKHWELGIDIRYEHQNRHHFRPRAISLPALTNSLDRFTLAPCIGYARDENFSFTIGSWFSVWGRNDFAIASLVSTIFWYF